MRSLCAIVTVVLGVVVIPGRPARAQVSVQIAVPAPAIRFEVAPPLVVVSPGVQVVPEYEEEVFFVDGWYWHRSGPYWYRTRDYRGGWVVVEQRYVPVALVRIPPGHYKHYKGKGLPPGQAKKFEREREGKFEREREHGRVFATPNGPPIGEEREKRGGEGKGHGHGKWKDKD
jgi:hypothetical protein